MALAPKVTLVFDEPLGRGEQRLQDHKVWKKLAARGTPHRLPKGRHLALHYLLMSLFAVGSEQEEVPVAAIEEAGETGCPVTGFWLRADPVTILPNMSELVMHDVYEGILTRAEALSLHDEISSLFPGEEVGLSNEQSGHWRIALRQEENLLTSPTKKVAGTAIADHLPIGEQGKKWQSLLNESQMLLHEHPLNLSRERQGEFPVTSLWFWGAGTAPEIIHLPSGAQVPSGAQGRWDGVHTDSVFLKGLAVLTDLPRFALAKNATEWLHGLAGLSGNHLIAPGLKNFGEFSGNDPDYWLGEWLSPLKKALAKGGLSGLEVLIIERGEVMAYEIRRSLWAKLFA